MAGLAVGWVDTVFPMPKGFQDGWMDGLVEYDDQRRR